MSLLKSLNTFLSSNSITDSKRIGQLDAVRGIAILLVVFYHYLYVLMTTLQPHVSGSFFIRALVAISSEGWVGVSLFFVLSGYLITNILLNNQSQPKYYFNFYLRRALRILPAYFVALALCWFLYPGQKTFLAFSAFFIANFARFFGISASVWTGFFWSLAVEEHFYLFWPLVVKKSKKWLWLACLAICVVSPLLRMVGFEKLWGRLTFSLVRFDGFAWGALLCCYLRSSWNRKRVTLIISSSFLLGASLLLVIFPEITIRTSPLGAGLQITLWEFLFLIFIGLVLTFPTLIPPKSLVSKALQVCGRLSYSLYLFHLVGFTFAEKLFPYFGSLPYSVSKLWLMKSLLAFVISFGMAFVSFYLIERPPLRMYRFFTFKSFRGVAPNLHSKVNSQQIA